MDKIKAGSQMNMPDERSAVQSTSRQGIGPPPPLGKDWTSLSSLPNLATGAANTPTIFKRDDFQEVYGQPASSRITLGYNEEIIKNNLSVLSTSPLMSANLSSVTPDDPLLPLLDLLSAAPESSSIESSSSVLNPRAARSEQEVNHRGDDTAARLGGKQNQDLAVDLCETRATSEPGKHHSVATQLDKLPARNAQDNIDDDSKPDLKEPADGWLSKGNGPLDDVHIPLSMDPVDEVSFDTESLQDQQSDPSELSTTTQSPPGVWRVVCQLRRPELTEEEKAAEAVDNAAISQALAQHFAMMRSDPAVARRRLDRPVAASSAEQSVPGAARNVFAGQHGKLGPLVSSSAEPDSGLDNVSSLASARDEITPKDPIVEEHRSVVNGTSSRGKWHVSEKDREGETQAQNSGDEALPKEIGVLERSNVHDSRKESPSLSAQHIPYAHVEEQRVS
ncbi:hypothetical protein Slin14017_G063130 [Septoria linicola]|nr:hypothetical protein Slin14017_G063130 [Septoria linicola]